MARFQALTNEVLDEELDRLRTRLGLEVSQKAELLREIAAISAWVLQQADQGRTVEARRGSQVEQLRHPAVQRLNRAPSERWFLTGDEVTRLAAILDTPKAITPALRKTLTNIANPKRKPPKVKWKKTAA